MDCNQIFQNENENEVKLSLCSFKKASPLKGFVQARLDTAPRSKNFGIISVSGTEVKKSYIDIIGNESFQSADNKNVGCKRVSIKEERTKTIISTNQNLNINQILKAAETNDVSKIAEFLETDKDIVLNSKDQYGWTTMMSACCAGAKDVVKLLLKFKPNLYLTDKKGNTCLKLAQSKGHTQIVTLLNDYLHSSRYKITKSNCGKDNCDKESALFYCETCKEAVRESDRSHLTSTVHLFNSSKKSGIPTAYGIPDSNVGFQLLLKTGWDREKGLGPEGSGHKFPPKTMLKQDRAGLGAKTYTARVTHNPVLAVKERSERQRTLNKRERLRNEIKSKRKERELRRALD